MFGVTNKVKNSDKNMWVYSSYGIVFDRLGSQGFGNRKHLLTEKKSMNLKSIIKMSIFQLNFVLEAYLINLILLNLHKYLLKEMCMMFQSITMLLLNLTYQAFINI